MKKNFLSGLAVIGLFVAGSLVTGCNKPSGITRPEGGVKHHMEAAVVGGGGGGGANNPATPPAQSEDKAAEDKAAEDKAAENDGK